MADYVSVLCGDDVRGARPQAKLGLGCERVVLK